MESNLERTGASAKATRRAVLGAAVVGTVWSVPVVKAAANAPGCAASAPTPPPPAGVSQNTFNADRARGQMILGRVTFQVISPALAATVIFRVDLTSADGSYLDHITGTLYPTSTQATGDFSFGPLPVGTYTLTTTATATVTSWTDYQNSGGPCTYSGSWNVVPSLFAPKGPITIATDW